MENLGIKDLKEIVIFFCRLTNGIDKSLVDGKISITDVGNFYAPLLAISDAYTDAKNALEEIKDLDAVEKQELVDLIRVELDLISDPIEEVVESVVSSALDFYMSYKRISELVKASKEVKVETV